ncbi:hypothetical protein DFH06DRAFT_1304324 [Mycena polygramma]|nr:hypothetical protein DFH06DRAFT_1304324 [Mycena polygramma]
MSLDTPVLPLELEREIFKTTAVRDPKSIPTLLRVCRRVHTWVEPLLYSVLTIFKWDTPLLAAIKSKSAPFLNSAVRHAYLHIYGTHAMDNLKAANLLSKCSGIINFSVNGDVDSELLDLLDRMRPQKLDITAPRKYSSDWPWGLATLNRPVFRAVTHLALFQTSRIAPWQDQWHGWPSLASLPALTHLSLSAHLSSDILPDVLAECPRLLLAITAFWGDYERERAIRFAQDLTVSDPRIVVMVVPDYTKDWEIGARGGADYWLRAEEFVARKREEGETEPIRYFLDESEVSD